MNNQIKTILFILLGVALFFTLYFVLHLEIEKKLSTASNVPNNEKTSVVTSTLLPDAKIAFVNIDTLNEKYLFIADYVKAMKKRKETIEAQLQAMMNQFQND
mgnify:CR=1 FL=1